MKLVVFLILMAAAGAMTRIIGRPPSSTCSDTWTIGAMRDVAICEFPPGRGKRAGGPMVKKGDDLVYNGTHFVAESHKAIICHTRNGLPPITISVSQQAVPAHLAHGDTQGPCPGGDACPAACDDLCPSACGNVTGQQGPPGQDGADGADGQDGVDGTNGADGADGADGAPGVNGTNGADGADGQDGADGAPGPPGPQGDCTNCPQPQQNVKMCCYIAVAGSSQTPNPSWPVIAQIVWRAGASCSRAFTGFLPCDGRLLSPGMFQLLFSVLGTTYGGDGRTTFALPDLTSMKGIIHEQ